MAKVKKEPEKINNSYITNLRNYLSSDSITTLLSTPSDLTHKYKSTVRDMEEDLDDMEKNLVDLKSLFYTGNLTEEEAEMLDKKEQSYPSNVKNFINTFSWVASSAALVATFFIIGTLIGGPAMAFWTPAVVGVSAALGVGFSIATFLGSRFGVLGLYKGVNFIFRNALNKKFASPKMYKNLSAINLQEDLEKYLTTKENNFTEKRIKTKTKKKKSKGKDAGYTPITTEHPEIVFKPPYDQLPKFLKKKLLNTLKKIDKLDSELRMAQEVLVKKHEKISAPTVTSTVKEVTTKEFGDTIEKADTPKMGMSVPKSSVTYGTGKSEEQDNSEAKIKDKTWITTKDGQRVFIEIQNGIPRVTKKIVNGIIISAVPKGKKPSSNSSNNSPNNNPKKR